MWLIDLALPDDLWLVPSALGSVLGLGIRSDYPLPGLVAFLGDRQVLLVLDYYAITRTSSRLAPPWPLPSSRARRRAHLTTGRAHRRRGAWLPGHSAVRRAAAANRAP